MEQVPETKRTTLYRMLEESTLATALNEDRRESDEYFTVTDLTIEERPARLVAGSITRPSKWANDVKILTGQEVKVSSRSPGAVLLIQDSAKTIWAVTWGTGFQFLDTEQIDFSFGAGVVARAALPSEVKSLTKTILDHRARVDRSSLPNGSNIRDLGVDGYGEVISRIESKARIGELSAGSKVIQLSAADSLKLPLAKTPEGLLRDLAVLRGLTKRPVLPGLESLEQLIALKPRDSRVPVLDRKLAIALQEEAPRSLGISWPHERLDVYGPVMSAKVTGIGDRERRVLDPVPDISDVQQWLADVPEHNVLDRIKSIRIELHSEADPARNTRISAPVSLRRWLAFEIEEDGKRFCLHDGNWYRMDDRYLARIDERVQEILSAPSSVQLPAWDRDAHDEGEYNKQVAAELSGYCLDRKLIRTPLHSRGGIEPCDVFVEPGILIHVKKARRSADLSHLLAQGLVSADALARDENARQAWTQRITEETGQKVRDAEIREIVLAIGRDQPVTTETLFTFTKVNLVKQFDALRYLGVEVRLTTALPPSQSS